jgi:hypothetical protein
MSKTNGDGTDDGPPPDERRRRLLIYAGLGAVGASGVAGAWAVSRPDDGRGSGSGPVEPSPTPSRSPTPDDEDGVDDTQPIPSIVARHAPDLYFGALEKWFPADPRLYTVESDGRTVVDGFTALEGYSEAFAETDTPPAPTAFYRIAEATDGVDAVQYWFYSVFDQFTVNFHWHDWELLQVFVDRESGTPLLVSASAHSRASPNNEFLEPDVSDGRRVGILSEVGSHSSASEVNDRVPSFERLPDDEWGSDVTNDVLDVTTGVTAPFAYGLPRDEGARLPFVMPELDGHRLDRHPGLSVDRGDFIDERVTVDSWRGLPRPPADVPLREPGPVLAHESSRTGTELTYALEPIEAVRDAVDDFVGPQLSFEFAIPGFLEDRYASHITSVGIPWEQERYDDPLADVTDPGHRRRIDGERPPGLTNRVVGRVRHLRAGYDGDLGRVADGARESLSGSIPVSMYDVPVEGAVRLASEDPVATVTRRGEFGYLHVVPGEHELVVNAPGIAPLALGFEHEGGLRRVGANGVLTVVANEDAGWVRGDGREATGIERVRVIEDHVGVVYEGRPIEEDRFAVAVHSEGRYTVEVVDSEGRPGAYRVGPEDFEDGTDAVREPVETGKAPLAETLVGEAERLVDLARALAARESDANADADANTDSDSQDADSENEVTERLSRALEEADAASGLAERGDASATDDRLSRVVSLFEETLEILASGRSGSYDDPATETLSSRIGPAIVRAETALATELG